MLKRQDKEKPIKIDYTKPEDKKSLSSTTNNLSDEISINEKNSFKEETKNFKIQLGAFNSLENAKIEISFFFSQIELVN